MFYLSAAAMHPNEGDVLPCYFPYFGALTTVEKIATVITGGGYALAKSHWDLGRVGDSWMHKAIAVIECCPLVGGIFLLIEQLIFAVLWSLVRKVSNSDQVSIKRFKRCLPKIPGGEAPVYPLSDILPEDQRFLIKIPLQIHSAYY